MILHIFPSEDMAITYQFCIEDNERSYRRDVTREWLNRQGINAKELFEKVRYKDLEQIWGEIKTIEQVGKNQRIHSRLLCMASMALVLPFIQK
ncbi:hypothetical protein LC724_24000 [Blautia sp. RD014234]|nr:hypothetical protein [Blautia parvula]